MRLNSTKSKYNTNYGQWSFPRVYDEITAFWKSVELFETREEIFNSAVALRLPPLGLRVANVEDHEEDTGSLGGLERDHRRSRIRERGAELLCLLHNLPFEERRG